MSAEVLRRAAALMRERAKASTPGPWIAAEQTHGEWYGLQSQWTAMGNLFEKSEAEHIASWHPAVALAVADWLDLFAETVADDEGMSIAYEEEVRVALAVARAYLGTTR